MARRARSYVRDARGRFASTPGGRPASRRRQPGGFRLRQQVKLAQQRRQTGRLGAATKAARDRLKAAKSRLGPESSPQQRGAVTRAKRAAAALSGRRRMAVARPAGVLAKGVKVRRADGTRTKPQRPPAPSAENQASAKQPRKPRQPAGATPKPTKKGGKKVDVQIKRAAPGGEYGPDGHFYPGGSWMPLGKFTGDQKKPAPTGDAGAVAGRKQGDGGDSGGTRTVRQKPKPRPRLQPAESTPLPQVNVSSRGMQNMRDFFRNGFYTNYKKGRDGFIEPVNAGWLQEAALATRLSPKQVSAAIVRLRKMAKDKKEFDADIAWERDLVRRRGYGYEEARRQGYIPRGMTQNQYDRVLQLFGAVNAIARQRQARTNNRRTGLEDYVWVMNNILGTRERRVPKSRKAQAQGGGAPRRIRGPRIRAAFRPVSTARLVAAGGSRWQKGPHDRVYFNQPGIGKVFFDRNTRKMVNQAGDVKGAALARRMERAGRRIPSRAWKPARQLRSQPQP